jgi:hypothetical protein
MTNFRRIAIISGCAVAATACGSSSHTTPTHAAPPLWSGLTRVSIDVDQPGVVPVPGAKHMPTTFTTPAQLTTVTTALNANHIRKAQHATANDGCTGGIVITIQITHRHSANTQLNAYHCAKTITGNVAGNLTAFLKQISDEVVGDPQKPRQRRRMQRHVTLTRPKRADERLRRQVLG